MGHKLNFPVTVSVLAGRLGLPFIGEDVEISSVTPLADAQQGGLCFSKNLFDNSQVSAGVVITPDKVAPRHGAFLISDRPRLDFARARICLAEAPGFSGFETPPAIHPTARLGSNTILGKGSVVDPNTIIQNNVVIGEGVRIGARCRNKSNTVIGEDGFGFERDEDGRPIRQVHLGSVVIGDDVEIGSLNTVCRGTLSDTVIESDVKTDDHVHIAHNCRIRRGALLTACVELSGGIDVGEYAWIGPNSSVINQVSIGDRAFVGIGANVTKSVTAGIAVAGNPARSLAKGQ